MIPANSKVSDWNYMIYRNSEMKLDQLVSYLNEEKINLNPAFQRGHVWSVGVRRKLISNIVQGRPIPAIFLYKEASGSRYSYNILDGKQRLESLILFIGSKREELSIKNWEKYFFGDRYRRDVDFSVELSNGKYTFNELDDAVIRDFREYSIPTIEITLNDESSLDEIINLFVDINQQGVPVNRFDIVKAMGKNDPLLRDVFRLLAIEQRRGQDVLYKAKQNEFTAVLKKMKIVENLPDANSKVDRMWERLLEVVLFSKTKKHRKPVEILKTFISNRDPQSPRFFKAEEKKLREIFRFLQHAYRTTDLSKTRLVTDQTHFYIMVTSLIGDDLLCNFSVPELIEKLVTFGKILDEKSLIPKNTRLNRNIKEYDELSKRQTTDVSRREQRQMKFIEIISSM
jgi:hypothetical protein